eukprot:scaffold95267_cov72-Phaeocystis_antarctica.AAC.1
MVQGKQRGVKTAFYWKTFVCAWRRSLTRRIPLHGKDFGTRRGPRGAVVACSKGSWSARTRHAVERLQQAEAMPRKGTLVPAPHIERSVGGRCCTTALQCVAERLRTGSGPVSIEAFGTSVTQGPGWDEVDRVANGQTGRPKSGGSYPAALHRAIARHWPLANHTIANRGKSGASIEYLSACVDRMLPQRGADLYLLETTDNLGFTTSADARLHFSDIIDAVLARRPGVAVILVSPFSVSCALRLLRRRQYKALASRDGVARCFANSSLPSVLAELAEERGLPIVSVRDGLRVELQADEDQDRHRVLLKYIQEDMVHPTLAGSTMLAEAVLRVLQGAAREAARPSPSAQQRLECAPSSSTERTSAETAPGARRALCAFGEALHPLVRRARGWSYVVERSSQGQPKPGYVAIAPGATLEVCHRDAESMWQFGYLRSYTGMGTARGECVQGCTCRPREWNAHRPKAQVSQTAISKLQRIRLLSARKNPRGRAPALGDERWAGCRCVIRLTLTNQTSSGGHKFKLEALFGAFAMYA